MEPAVYRVLRGPDRWQALQQLRRGGLDRPLDWLEALADPEGVCDGPLLRLIAETVDPDGPEPLALLAWVLAAPAADWAEPLAALTPLLVRRRPALAAGLRRALGRGGDALLLPLLGSQRDPADAALLIDRARRPGPADERRAALEGLARGFSAWPPRPLRQLLLALAHDLDPLLAAGAVDLLDRLPWPLLGLDRLDGARLDPAVAARLARRRARRRPSDLLLLAHGRAGGLAPAELSSLADELGRRRGGRVFLQVLTDPDAVAAAAPAPLTLVPLFLLPGEHVRHDVAVVADAWRRRGWPLRRLPYLGAWPAWRQGLAQALAEQRALGREPLLLHHPLSGPLACRHGAALTRRLGVPCRPWDGAEAEGAAAYMDGQPSTVPVPLALATNRLTEALAAPPLLLQPRFRSLLLEQLLHLP
ncbi:MAG: hypothetical protein ACOYMY_08340 [Prochlorococcaceae cyanobacterium]